MIRSKHSFQPKRDRSEEFASYVAPPLPRARVVMVSNERPSTPAIPKANRKVRTIKALRESARGETCTLELPGCPGGTEHTILSHARWSEAGKGGAIKAVDIATAYACTHCDGVYDGQVPRAEGWSQEMVDRRWHFGHLKTLVRFVQKGLV